MLKVQRQLSILFLLFAGVTSSLFPTAVGAEPPEETSSIVIGPAIFNCCKLVRLVSETHRHDEIETDSTQKNFQQTQKWLISNVWTKISRTPKIQSKAEYLLYLHADVDGAKDITSTILLGIPLTAETLGSDYQRKIVELHKIMASAKTNAPQ